MTAFDPANLAARTETRLETLCLTHPDRSVGSPGGLAATEFVASEFADLGIQVERLPFECVVWVPGEARLNAAGVQYVVYPGPYSPGTDVQAPLFAASSLDELDGLDARDGVLLLHGEIARDQMVPKNYPFYSMEEHTRIVAEIERQSPEAVIAATGSNPGAVGSLCPFPLFEDADFSVPSVYMHEDDGAHLLASVGSAVHLRIASGTRQAHAEQLVARIPGSGGGRFVVTAHIDSRHGTPGAIDNAAGVCILLGIAEQLRDTRMRHTIELVPFNGEDNFAAYGEMAYLRAPGSDLSDVTLAINIDAAGYHKGTSAMSTYECPPRFTEALEDVLTRHARVTAGPAWPQSDHMIFAMRGVPAMAVTTSEFAEVTSRYTHGPNDLPGLIDPALVTETATAIADLLKELDSANG